MSILRTALPLIGRFAQGLLAAALPDHCAVCEARASRQLCPRCALAFDAARAQATRRCERCAIAMPAVPDDTTLGESATICRTPSVVCGACLRRPPAFDAAIALADYVAPLDALMIRLKYHGALPLAREFGERLGDALLPVCGRDNVRDGDSVGVGVGDDVGDGAPWLVPVPLAPARLAARGFNQAWELTRVAARRMQRPASARWLRRERATASQRGLTRDVRQRNLRDAFIASDRVRGRRIVLIDDVMTTGATCHAAARALKRAGAAHVVAAVVLRTPYSE